MSAPQILKEIFLGNHQFVQACGKEFFESHIEEQNPLITLVTCSDSRVQPSIDFSGKFFKISKLVEGGYWALRNPIKAKNIGCGLEPPRRRDRHAPPPILGGDSSASY